MKTEEQYKVLMDRKNILEAHMNMTPKDKKNNYKQKIDELTFMIDSIFDLTECPKCGDLMRVECLECKK